MREKPRIEFVDAPVGGPLSGLVAGMVGYRMSGMAPALHRGVPSPSLTFILNLDTPVVVGSGPAALREGTTRGYDNLVAGLHLRATYIFQPSHQAGVQLALHPLAARRLVGAPAGELGDGSHDAVDVLGAGLGRLQEEVAGLAGWPERFAAIEAYLGRRLTDAPAGGEPRPEVGAAWRWLAAHRGRGRIDDLARHVLLSPRQLTKVFRVELGVTPKSVNRLIRFGHARRVLQARVLAGRDRALADVAVAAGYYDHAHLVRDFQEFLGCSPTAWLDEEFGNIQAGGHRHGAPSQV